MDQTLPTPKTSDAQVSNPENRTNSATGLFEEGWFSSFAQSEPIGASNQTASIFEEGWASSFDKPNTDTRPDKPPTDRNLDTSLFGEGWSDFSASENKVPDNRFRWDTNPGQVRPQDSNRLPGNDNRFDWQDGYNNPDYHRPDQRPQYDQRDGSDRQVEREVVRTGDRVTDTINTINGIPERHQQMVVVTTANKSATTGELRVYERGNNGAWVDSGKRIPINVGRNGLNWGVKNQELLDTSDLTDRRKVEGDGTGPIGLFTVSGAFGLKSNGGIQSQLQGEGANPSDLLPYRQIVQGSQWVSTRNDYNVWIDGGRHSVKEDLYRIAKSGLYEYGLVLGYNGADMFNGRSGDGYPVGQAQYKGGSAIFAHVEKGRGRPTAGCTSMSKANMVRLMATLENSKSPLWLQIPRSELDKIEGRNFKHP